MIILGLTGSIAMGKSTMAKLFRNEDVPVHDADETVHRLMSPKGKAVEAIAFLFPKTMTADGGIDRRILGEMVFSDGKLRQQLEEILHPLVKSDRDDWLCRQRESSSFCVGLDVPLLFETGGEVDCDYTAVSVCSGYLQRQRALGRGMSEERFNAILALQMPADIKKAKADFIVPSDYGKSASRWYIQRILRQLKNRSNHA